MITALYDGHCVICQTIRRIISGLDWFGRIEFVDLHDTAQIAERFPQFERDALMGEIHVIAHSETFIGFDGMRRMLRETPLGIPLWLVFLLPGMQRLGPAVYRFIARHRYGINRFFGVDLDAEDPCDDVNGVCKLPR